MNNTISINEQIDFFNTTYSYELIQLLEKIKNNYGETILNKHNRNMSAEFIDLILHSLDLKKLYLKHY